MGLLRLSKFSELPPGIDIYKTWVSRLDFYQKNFQKESIKELHCIQQFLYLNIISTGLEVGKQADGIINYKKK